MGVGGQHHAPAAFTPGKDTVPVEQEAGWASESVYIGAENLASTGFDPRTFHPVASRYTDYAIRLRMLLNNTIKNISINNSSNRAISISTITRYTYEAICMKLNFTLNCFTR